MNTLVVLLVALVADRIIGDPDWLWRRVKHPVVVFGSAIAFFDQRLNVPTLSERQREKYGFISIAILLGAAVAAGLLISLLLEMIGWIGFAIECTIVAVLLAQKSLAQHVGSVASGLRDGGVEGGRRAVSMIVGRDPSSLNEAGVCRAAIESLAENASDGVVAPAFWFAVFGLPGLFAYKMLNTADSMIGHQNEKYRAFGRASAKFDDLANWLPARMTSMMILIAGGASDIEDNFRLIVRDAKLHRSPNAGWPESAMAGATDLALGGPRVYRGGDATHEPFMNDLGRKNINADDIDRAIGVFWKTMTLGTAIVAMLAFLLT